ncbi:hypothetical protein MNBD_BACTEROID07-905 [hydrothermal vent metagenome]|uniref:Uncharacterized protein n=1 Tax=hydrothermal vent metagenome TaxID=652676 RepID=A0A3B0VCS8_9ZZZZ
MQGVNAALVPDKKTECIYSLLLYLQPANFTCHKSHKILPLQPMKLLIIEDDCEIQESILAYLGQNIDMQFLP